MSRRKTNAYLEMVQHIANEWHFSFSSDQQLKLQARLKREGVDDTESVTTTINELERLGDRYFKLMYVLGEELLRQSPTLLEDDFNHPERDWATAPVMTRIAVGHHHEKASDAFIFACFAMAKTWRDATGKQLAWPGKRPWKGVEARHPIEIIAGQMSGVGLASVLDKVDL